MAITIVETENWLLKLPPQAAAAHLLAAMRAAGIAADRDGDGTLRAEAKSSWRKNRWKAQLEVSFDAVDVGTWARWRVDMAGDKHFDLLDEIAAGLDAGLIDDRGVGAAVARLGADLPDARELRGVQTRIDADEQVEALGKGVHEQRGTVAVLTGRRLLLYARTRRQETVEELPRAKIESIEAERGASGDALVIRAAGRRLELRPMRPGHADGLARAFGSAPAAAPGPEPDPIELLRRLGELRDAGVVTPEEFEAKKAALLDRI